MIERDSISGFKKRNGRKSLPLQNKTLQLIDISLLKQDPSIFYALRVYLLKIKFLNCPFASEILLHRYQAEYQLERNRGIQNTL